MFYIYYNKTDKFNSRSNIVIIIKVKTLLSL
jgi:hypothetical protein